MFNAKTWHDGEMLAQKYLKKLGYKILETNSRLAGSEVDIVAICSKKLAIQALKNDCKAKKLDRFAFAGLKKNQKDILVFVEVKARTREDFGTPEQAVTKIKQLAIKRFANAFVKKYDYSEFEIRFDVISVVGDEICHYENAFV